MGLTYFFVFLLAFLVQPAHLEPIMGSFQYEKTVWVSWVIENHNITITMKAICKGWLGLGFSQNGDMAGADIVIAWMGKDGKPVLQDRYATAKALPLLDSHNDYDLLNFTQDENYTQFTARRKLITCDPNDYRLTSDTVKIIFAWTDTTPNDEDDIVYHGMNNRGVRAKLLFNGDKTEAPNTKGLDYWDIMATNYPIPSKGTTYMCVIRKLPDKFREKQYFFIGREPLIPDDMIPYVHHRQIQLCYGNDTLNEQDLDKPFDCTSVEGNSRCMKFVSEWAVGSGSEFVPDNVGVPMGSKWGASDYLMMNTHYNNPNNLEGLIDNSGMRFYITEEKRQNVAGSFAMIGFPDIKMIIPPGQPIFKVSSIFPAECTKQIISETGIFIYNVMLHSHTHGVSIKLRHFRGDYELPPIAQDKNYDFNYQQAHELQKHVQVLPNDILVLQCTYNSAGDKKATLAGFSTHDEMCFCFGQFYPPGNVSYIFDGVVPEEIAPYFENPDNKTLLEVIQNYDWSKFSEEQMKKFQEHTFYGNKSGYCFDDAANAKTLFKTSFPKVKYPYVEKDVCKNC